MRSGVDPYLVLGVSPGAEDVVVRAAYKALLRKYHPDVCADPAAADRTRTITEAYGVLGDPQTRRAFDQARRAPPRPAPPYRPAAAPARRAPPPPAWRAARLRRRSPIRWRRWIAGLFIALPLFAVGGFGSRLFLQRHPALDAALHAHAHAMLARAHEMLPLQAPAEAESAPSPRVSAASPPDELTMAQGGAAASALILSKGEQPAAKASRECGTQQLAPDWQTADYCAAFDIAAAATLTITGTPSDYFGQVPSNIAARYERFGLVADEQRIEAIRASVTPGAFAHAEQALEDRQSLDRARIDGQDMSLGDAAPRKSAGATLDAP